MKKITSIIDTLSVYLGWFARPVLVVLVVSMLYEVFSRYFMGAPTKWAFDISYMFNGTIFVLGASYALYKDDHVKIDFLANKIPEKARAVIDIILYGFIFAPLVAGLSWTAIHRALRAYERGEVEAVSPWAPLMWPFYTAIAIGLSALFLQCLSVAMKNYIKAKHKTKGCEE